MPKLRVYISMSLDGYAAGPDATDEHPLGVGGEALHEWALATAAWRESHGQSGGERNADDEVMASSTDNVGATIMGRNMFGPMEGTLETRPDWQGWWGDTPPFHHPVFVLSHVARDPLALEGTTFHFVTDGIESALEQAYAAAGGQDVRIGGGAETVQQYLRAGLVDELLVSVVPTLLGGGRRLFHQLDGAPAGFDVGEVVRGAGNVAHFHLTRRR